MADMTLNVSGMSCSGCADSVTRAVQKVDPDATVSVDLASGTVKIENAAARAPIEAAIIKAG